MGSFPNHLLIIDTETTGLLRSHVVLQLAAVLINRHNLKEIKSFSSYVRTSKALYNACTDGAFKTHGITYNMVEHAPEWNKVKAQFTQTFRDYAYDVAGQNILQFDIPMLQSMEGPGFTSQLIWLQGRKRKRSRYIDLWPVFLTAGVFLDHPYGEKYASLRRVADHYNIKVGDKHDALEDCFITAEALRCTRQAIVGDNYGPRSFLRHS